MSTLLTKKIMSTLLPNAISPPFFFLSYAIYFCFGNKVFSTFKQMVWYIVGLGLNSSNLTCTYIGKTAHETALYMSIDVGCCAPNTSHRLNTWFPRKRLGNLKIKTVKLNFTCVRNTIWLELCSFKGYTNELTLL